MNQGKQIRVIKRGAGTSLPGEPGAIVRPTPRAEKREAAAVVTEWVRELRRKKSVEASRAFEILSGGAALVNGPRAAGSGING